jgi:hypothetical protein
LQRQPGGVAGEGDVVAVVAELGLVQGDGGHGDSRFLVPCFLEYRSEPYSIGANDHEVVATPRKMKDAARETAQRGR